MMKIMKDKWAKNEKRFKQALENIKDLNAISYDELVKLAFENIYNSDCKNDFEYLDLDNITTIDNGDYQGTVLYVIPFNTYQPSEYEYLMTYVRYGSCSGCDTLLEIKEYDNDEIKLKCFLQLGKDIICNTIKPYNEAWRNKSWYDEEDFETVEFD